MTNTFDAVAQELNTELERINEHLGALRQEEQKLFQQICYYREKHNRVLIAKRALEGQPAVPLRRTRARQHAPQEIVDILVRFSNLTAAEIAARIGVSTQTVNLWRSKYGVKNFTAEVNVSK